MARNPVFTEEDKARKLKHCHKRAKRCAKIAETFGCMQLLAKWKDIPEAELDLKLTAMDARLEDAMREEGMPEPDGLALGDDWWKSEDEEATRRRARLGLAADSV